MNSNSKKISIITINLNNCEGLHSTILSVKNQNYTDYEFILIDGNSNDGSKQIIEKYQELFYYFIIEEDKGIYNAMNKGISKSTGDYLLFLNSGDTLINEFSLHNAINYKVNSDLVFYSYLNQNDKIKERLKFSDFWFKFSFSHQAIFFKRDLFIELGLYRENLDIVADWEFVLRALVMNKTYVIINFEIVSIDFTGVSSSIDGSKKSFLERSKILENQYDILYQDYKDLNYYRNSRVFRLINSILNKFGKGVYKY